MTELRADEVAAIAKQREQAEISDFDLARQMFDQVETNNAFDLLPIQVGSGVAYPIESGVINMPTDFHQRRDGDNIIGKPFGESLPPEACATYISFWDGHSEAAVYSVSRPVGLSPDGTIVEPIGSVAKAVLEGRVRMGTKKVPGIEADIYSSYPNLGAITATLAEDTELRSAVIEPADDEHGMRVSVTLSGPLRVTDLRYHRYKKVDNDRVYESGGDDSEDEADIQFPGDLMTFQIPLVDEFSSLRIQDGHLLAAGDEHAEQLLDQYSVAELARQAVTAHNGMADERALALEFGIRILALPEMDLRAHEVLADRFGWMDLTDDFLEFSRYEIRDVLKQRITERGEAAILEALEDGQHTTVASVIGPAAVRNYILHSDLYAANTGTA